MQCSAVEIDISTWRLHKGRQFWQSQVASINDEDDSFKLLQENVNELKSRGLVDGYLTVDDYINIDFEVCTSETSAITDREILGSILIKESNDEPPEKSKLLEIPHAVELLECRSFFDNNGGKIKQSLSLISKRFGKHVEVRITGSLLYLYYDVSRSNR